MQHFRSNEAFECYRTYLALKRHFTSAYDFFKYNGKVKVSIHSFEKRNDRFQFAQVAKNPEWKELMLSNIVKDPNVWIGSLDETPLIEMKKRRTSLMYHYQQQIKKLDPAFNANIEVTGDRTYPYLLELYFQNEISIDTIAILDRLVNFIPYWDKNVKETIIWPKHSLLIKKYQPFLTFDEAKFRKKTYETFK